MTFVLKRSDAVTATKPDPRASSSGGSVTGSMAGAAAGAGAGARSAAAGRGRLQGIPEDRSVSAASAGRGQGQGAGPGGAKAGVACPVVSYRGSKTRVEVAGLEANRYYLFKVRARSGRVGMERDSRYLVERLEIFRGPPHCPLYDPFLINISLPPLPPLHSCASRAPAAIRFSPSPWAS